MYMTSREVKGTWDGTLGIMATNILGLVGAPCSRNAWSCRANKQASVPDQAGTCHWSLLMYPVFQLGCKYCTTEDVLWSKANAAKIAII